jgi:prepilin signal peptidase PulO-like enzyme (type II secretory pathway)
MITLVNPKQCFAMVLLLSAAMAATRFNHFGSAVSPPDASLAVFFLAGFYLQPISFFPVFLAEAALIDYAAVAGGTSGWCVTPAYAFLIPTYACLWLAGRWYTRRHQDAWRTFMPLALALFVSTSVAFLISNGSFYLFSGYFEKMSWGEYAARVVKYYPPYVAIVFFYVASAAVLHALVGALKVEHPEGGTPRGV